jgi:hypothetical protein
MKKCRAANASFYFCQSVFGMVFAILVKLCRAGCGRQSRGCQSGESVLMDTHPPTVKVLEDQGRHELQDGDCVQFSRLQGAPGMK